MNPTRPQSAAEAASVERLGALLEDAINQRKPAEDLHGSDDISLQPKPGEGLDIIPRVSRLDGETSDRVRAMESRTKRRSSRGFARFLVAICIGVAGTLAWQSYGEATKQIIAASAPELGWSPEAKQMIASWVQQLSWSKPATGPENTAAQLPVPKMAQAAPLTQVGASTSKPGAPSLDQQTVEQRLAAVRESVEQLAVGQDQVLREIAKLHEEILKKIPASPQQLPALPARKPTPAPASSSSRAPIPPPPAPIPPPHP